MPHGTEALTCDCQAGKLQVMFSLQPSEGSHIQAYTTDSGCSYEMPKSNCTENITDQALCLQHIDKKLRFPLMLFITLILNNCAELICLECWGGEPQTRPPPLQARPFPFC